MLSAFCTAQGKRADEVFLMLNGSGGDTARALSPGTQQALLMLFLSLLQKIWYLQNVVSCLSKFTDICVVFLSARNLFFLLKHSVPSRCVTQSEFLNGEQYYLHTSAFIL